MFRWNLGSEVPTEFTEKQFFPVKKTKKQKTRRNRDSLLSARDIRTVQYTVYVHPTHFQNLLLRLD